MTRHIVILVLLLGLSVSAHAQQTTLNVLLTGWGSSEQRYLEENVVPEFEQKFGVKVEFQRVSFGSRTERLMVLTAAGTPPDIFMNGRQHLIDLINLDFVEPLDQYIARDWADEYADFFPPTLGTSTHNGVAYGLPHRAGPRVWWYWKSLFHQVGLDAEAPPKTWNELLAASRRLTRVEGDTVHVQGYEIDHYIDGSFSDFQTFMWQHGGEMFHPETFVSNFNTELGREVAEFLVTLRQVSAPLGYDSSRGEDFPIKGSAISYRSGGFVDDILDQPEELADLGAIPVLGDVETVTATADNWIAIHRQSANKDLAWEFLKRMVDAKVLYDINLAAGQVSPRISTMQLFREASPIANTLYQALNQARGAPPIPNAEALEKIFQDNVGPALQGLVPIERAFEEAARLWDAFLLSN